MRLGKGCVRWGRRLFVVQLGVLAILVSACDTSGPQSAQVGTPGVTATLPSPSDATSDLPTESPATPTLSPANLSDEDRDAIYGLVVLNLVKTEQATDVYISPYVGEGEQLDESNTAKPLNEGLATSLQSLDSARRYAMAEFSAVVGPPEDGGKVQNEGVFLTLGEIVAEPEGTVAVRGSIYRKLGSAAGSLYHFLRDDNAPDGWKLLEVEQEWSGE